MRITVIGTGYVGLVTGTCFAEMGNSVVCVDTNEDKIARLKEGEIPIYEPGLKELVQKNFSKGSLKFTTSLAEGLMDTEVAFIAVGTPMGDDGSADLQYVLSVASSIGEHMQDDLIVVDKSTVPVGTADKVRATIQGELTARNSSYEFDVISNPEFLKEGAAVNDFMKPDRVVVGADKESSLEVMRRLYNPFFKTRDRLVTMDVRSAEMTKYAANAMLATKISFMNEMANICERIGADVNMVREGIGSDSRIGYSFIFPGCGYGGSCFPKDVKALSKIASDYGYESALINSVEKVNDVQKTILAEKVKKRFGSDLSGKTFGIWGLAFKPETDDMREATAIYTVQILSALGAKFKVYDPKAMDEAKMHYLKPYAEAVTYCTNKYDVLDEVDALIMHTEWKEFRSPDFDEMTKRMKTSIFFDGRNQFVDKTMADLGFEYFRIGK